MDCHKVFALLINESGGLPEDLFIMKLAQIENLIQIHLILNDAWDVRNRDINLILTMLGMSGIVK